MLTISPAAQALIAGKGGAVRLDLGRTVYGGCGVPPLHERPAVRFGPPPAGTADQYRLESIDGIAVHLPRALPRDRDLTVAVASFLGLKRLVLEGWNLLDWELLPSDRRAP